MTSAADWLIARGPQLERIAAETRIEDALDAVGYPDSWLWFRLEALTCECGTLIRRGRGPLCASCRERWNEQYRQDQPRIGCDPCGPLDGVEPT